MLGFNFAPVSRRRVSPDVAGRAVTDCRATVRATPAMVGIFVNQPLPEIAKVVRGCGLDYVQLSGDEDVTFARAVKADTGARVIKAVRLERPNEEHVIEDFLEGEGADLLLADSTVTGAWGGSGTAWDWGRAAALAARHPLLLAGGITAANVRSAIETVKPLGVDVASGVETEGTTDPSKVALFVEQVKHVHYF
jgi:phosphoribosylanthranilate isomerase